MDDLFTTSAYAVLEQFITSPAKRFSARALARGTNLSHATILTYLKELTKRSLVVIDKSTLYPTYYANTSSKEYVFYKKNWMQYRIQQSGVISYISKHCIPSCIILFGSAAKGSFTKRSDVDLFVQSKPVSLDLSVYEKQLGRKIHVLFESKPKTLSQELKTNLLNSVVLHGYVQPTQWIITNA